jgi:cellulose synthase/poly-beta-1,6-N-acetylglucosamine synthase-like glycosyltransferase
MALVVLILRLREVWRIWYEPLLDRDLPTACVDAGNQPGDQEPFPRLAIIIPARNEAARIGACLEGIAQQTIPAAEVIVLDDHSSDETATRARAYASRIAGLRVVAGADLPTGWSGKCWACWQAAGQARAEWLLFLDADVTVHPELIATLLHFVRREPIDLLTLMPLVRMGSWAEQLILPAFFRLIAAIYPFNQVNDRNSPLAFAIGQVLLIRRSAYEQIDGHRAVAASILEDMDLAGRAKQAGLQLKVLHAPTLAEVRMYDGWHSLAEGLGKNATAGYRYGGVRSGLIALLLALAAWVPFHLLALSGAALWAWWLLVLVGAIDMLIGWQRFRMQPWLGLLYPIGLLIYFLLALWATLRLRRGQGVFWKGRMYT